VLAKTRIFEQAQSSLATFLTSVIVLKSLDAKYVSEFYIGTTGCQAAFALLSARVVTPIVASQVDVRYTPTCVRRLLSRAWLFGLPVATVAYLSTTHLRLASVVNDVREWLVLVVYCAALLGFEILRRLAATRDFTQDASALLVAQAARLASPLVLLSLWTASSLSWWSFFAVLCAFLTLGTWILARTLIRSVGTCRYVDLVRSTAGSLPSWSNSIAEGLTIVAWAHVPVFLLAYVAGSAAVAQLVAVRTPVSFFNVVLEYVEVHTRRYAFGRLWRERRSLLVAIAIVFWMVTSAALYLCAPVLIRVIATGRYTGARVELVLFWLLQLAILVDKVTFNEQRRLAPKTMALSSSLIFALGSTAIAYVLISFGATAGAITAMVLWCSANVAARRTHLSPHVQTAG